MVTEYPDEDFDQGPVEDEASKYVEAVAGATYGLRRTVNENYEFAPAITHLNFKSFIDGEAITGRIMSREDLESKDTAVHIVEDMEVVNGKVREAKLRFASLDTYGNV